MKLLRSLLIAIMTLYLACLTLEACKRNLSSLAVTHLLAKEEILQSNKLLVSVPAPDSSSYSIWEALLGHKSDEVAERMLSEKDNSWIESLRQWSHLDQIVSSSPWVTAPLGVAEYQYSLALQAISCDAPTSAVTHFGYAVTYRPGPWSSEFYAKYQSALAKADPDYAAHITLERSNNPASVAQVQVGDRYHERWTSSLLLYKDWALQGYTLRTPKALELGMPIILDLYWINAQGQIKREMISTWNRVSNGGMELISQQRALGWFQTTIEFDSYAWALQQKIRLGDNETTVLVGQLARNGLYDIKLTRPIAVIPSSKVLWSVRVDGDPVVNVYWLDLNHRIVGSGTLLDGTRGVALYASVVDVPANANYMLLLLQTARGTQIVVWDDVFVIPIFPPQF